MKKVAFSAILTVLFTANVEAASFFTYTPQAKSVGLYLSGQIWQSEASVFGVKNT